MLGRNLEDSPVEEVPKWERPYIWSIPFNLLVDDFERMDKERDPILYPFHIGDEEAKLLPKTVLFTSEFCWLRRDTHMLVPKLKKAGVYEDHGDYAGSAHSSYMFFGKDPNFKLFHQDLRKVFSDLQSNQQTPLE